MQEKVYTRDIILILAASFCYLGCTMLVNALIIGFTESLGTGAFLMGLIGGLTNICSLCCRPFVGNIADHVAKGNMTLFGLVCLLLSAVGYALAPNPAVVVVLRLLHGVGFAVCTVGLTTWMSNMLPKDKIGSGMGLYGTMNALAMAIAPSIGVRVYQSFGYRPAFVLALSFAALAVVFALQVKDKGCPKEQAKEKKTAEKEKFRLFDKNVLAIAMIIMLFTIPYYATQSFLVRYCETRELAVTVSLFFTFYAAVLLVLRLSLKRFFDTVPFGVFVLCSTICAVLSIICLTFMDNNLWMFAAAVFMAGGFGLMCSVCQSNALLLAPPEHRGLANSTYYIGMDLGMAFAPMIGGVLYGNLPIEYFYPVFLFTVPLIGVAFFAHRRVQAKRQL